MNEREWVAAIENACGSRSHQSSYSSAMRSLVHTLVPSATVARIISGSGPDHIRKISALTWVHQDSLLPSLLHTSLSTNLFTCLLHREALTWLLSGNDPQVKINADYNRQHLTPPTEAVGPLPPTANRPGPGLACTGGATTAQYNGLADL